MQTSRHSDLPPEPAGLRWEHNGWFNENDEELEKHVDRYKDARTGMQCFSKRCKDENGKRYWWDPDSPEKTDPDFPRPTSFVETDQPKGEFELERDLREEYPKTLGTEKVHDDIRDFVKEKLDNNGGYVTEWELEQ